MLCRYVKLRLDMFSFWVVRCLVWSEGELTRQATWFDPFICRVVLSKHRVTWLSFILWKWLFISFYNCVQKNQKCLAIKNLSENSFPSIISIDAAATLCGMWPVIQDILHRNYANVDYRTDHYLTLCHCYCYMRHIVIIILDNNIITRAVELGPMSKKGFSWKSKVFTHVSRTSNKITLAFPCRIRRHKCVCM